MLSLKYKLYVIGNVYVIMRFEYMCGNEIVEFPI